MGNAFHGACYDVCCVLCIFDMLMRHVYWVLYIVCVDCVPWLVCNVLYSGGCVALVGYYVMYVVYCVLSYVCYTCNAMWRTLCVT